MSRTLESLLLLALLTSGCQSTAGAPEDPEENGDESGVTDDLQFIVEEQYEGSLDDLWAMGWSDIGENPLCFVEEGRLIVKTDQVEERHCVLAKAIDVQADVLELEFNAAFRCNYACAVDLALYDGSPSEGAPVTRLRYSFTWNPYDLYMEHEDCVVSVGDTEAAFYFDASSPFKIFHTYRLRIEPRGISVWIDDEPLLTELPLPAGQTLVRANTVVVDLTNQNPVHEVWLEDLTVAVGSSPVQ